MVANKAASHNQPAFMVRSGARLVFRIHLSAGSRRGWVPLMVTAPTKLRIGFSKSDQGDTLEVTFAMPQGPPCKLDNKASFSTA